MRVMPNMLIAAPGDPMETRACLRYLTANPQPSYLRLGKAGEPNLHQAPPVLEPGRWVKVREGSSDETLLSTGAALATAIERSERCGASVYSLPLWGMESKARQFDHVRKVSSVTTFEDHLVDGGFGSWMFEAVASDKESAAKLTTIALSADVCGTVGSQNTLNALGGLK